LTKPNSLECGRKSAAPKSTSSLECGRKSAAPGGPPPASQHAAAQVRIFAPETKNLEFTYHYQIGVVYQNRA
jgi:hypothetical protein